MRKAAMVLALLLASVGPGCLTAPERSPTAAWACATFAECLFTQDGALEVVVHASAGAPSPRAGLAAFERELAQLGQRPLAVVEGAAVGPLPDEVDDAALQALSADQDPRRLDLYVLDTVRLEGDEPTSGLSFPGSPVVFLFPETMDLRVRQAGLDGEEANATRAVLEAVILLHEVGHALGLVGCGIPMQAPHADPASSCHSANASSLMHSKVARVAAWGPSDPGAAYGPFAWDADDLADLAAYRDAIRSDR
jgi:hypothetical protein